MYKLAYALIEDSDQPAHQRRLIRVFDGRSMGSRGFNVSSEWKTKTLIRLCGCTDWFQSSLYAHSKLYLILGSGSFIEQLLQEFSELQRRRVLQVVFLRQIIIAPVIARSPPIRTEAIEKLPICDVRALTQIIRENCYKHVTFELRFVRLYWYTGSPGPEIIKKISYST